MRNVFVIMLALRNLDPEVRIEVALVSKLLYLGDHDICGLAVLFTELSASGD